MLSVMRADTPTFVKFVTSDLSEHGAFIVSSEPPPVGTVLDVVLSFPGFFSPVQKKGVVRWTKPKTMGGPQPKAGFGIEWLEPLNTEVLLKALRGGGEPMRLSPSPAGSTPAYRVLVADDNQHSRGMVTRSLVNSAGRDAVHLEVIDVGDGQAAWHRLKQGDIDLLFIERYLPVIDGLTLIERARNTPGLRSIPIMMCSTGQTDTCALALGSGADFYIAKPFRLSDILDTVYRLLRVQVPG